MTTDIASRPVGNDGLAGRRILVAEDRGLIAVKVAQVLRGAGCVVVGPVGTLAAGLEIARRDDGLPDAGVLDIDLHGEQVFPLAEALRARRVPSLFLTGYGPRSASRSHGATCPISRSRSTPRTCSRLWSPSWRATPPSLTTECRFPAVRRTSSRSPGR